MRGQITVLGGGVSAEANISICSAQAVLEALKSGGDVRLEIMTSHALPENLNPQNDILFLTTHGTFGEDGSLQTLLDERGFIYTGSDAASSRLCFDKQRSKVVAERLGIRVPEGIVFHEAPTAKVLWKAFGPKLVLKPNAQGSSVGVHIIKSLGELKKILPKLGREPYLAERFIEGREITVGILGHEALAPVEIIPNVGIYNYANKYTAGNTRYESPAKLTPEVTQAARNAALKIFEACGCRDFARVDFRLGTDNKLYFLEINTLPGLTATSLLPKSAAPLGYDFAKLLNEMLRGARARFAEKYAMAVA